MEQHDTARPVHSEQSQGGVREGGSWVQKNSERDSFYEGLFMGSAGVAESVLYSPHFALVLFRAGPGCAVLCCAGPVEEGRGGEDGSDQLLRRVQTC